MFRFVLPVALLLLTISSGFAAHGSKASAQVSVAQTPSATNTEGGLQSYLPPCLTEPDLGRNCRRVLACIGDQGLYFDGQARGNGVGIILGRISDGTQCSGHWSHIHGTDARGEGRARLKCTDGSRFHVIYDTRDTRHGTHFGIGKDSHGRMIRAWSGHDVLTYLTTENEAPSLKCGDRMVPLTAHVTEEP